MYMFINKEPSKLYCISNHEFSIIIAREYVLITTSIWLYIYHVYLHTKEPLLCSKIIYNPHMSDFSSKEESMRSENQLQIHVEIYVIRGKHVCVT